MVLKKVPAKKADRATVAADGRVGNFPLHRLRLDVDNPRFGGTTADEDEGQIVAQIIERAGIHDVVASIASNGYFESEPLVGAINKDPNDPDAIVILEGNRRLTACLVLAHDPRAEPFFGMADKYPDSKFRAKDELPVQVYDWKNKQHRLRLLPYLGVRHIVGAQQWDSYAKAAWVARTVRDTELSLAQVRRMIGDEQNLTERIIEGFYIVEQLTSSGIYNKSESLRRGRGSFLAFPFSWLYTAMGYKSVREYVGLPTASLTEPEPLSGANAERAANVCRYMFGGAGRQAAIEDSREIGLLARALSSDGGKAALAEGKTVAEAIEAEKPHGEQVQTQLQRSDKSLGEALRLLSTGTAVTPADMTKIDEQVGVLYSRLDAVDAAAQQLKSGRRRGSRSARGA